VKFCNVHKLLVNPASSVQLCGCHVWLCSSASAMLPIALCDVLLGAVLCSVPQVIF
jgi:hypothetical protein